MTHEDDFLMGIGKFYPDLPLVGILLMELEGLPGASCRASPWTFRAVGLGWGGRLERHALRGNVEVEGLGL